ncbi:HD-GYP domain-containing protein [Synechococcus sp. ATX 2A4]|uniref:HD-GYP domain-containing protein n=1 Tax=Synechococcus sp. ATX 2A4 TaxID=2823727 RepID=UPI0020CD0CD6|nr:HD-GYP domain-containing protein [Synechococcus sp. ATX 2A4]
MSSAAGVSLLPIQQALKERTKELHCLQQIEQIVRANAGGIDDILQNVVDTIPFAWRHSASAIARISRGERIYQTGDFDRCLSVLSVQIKANDNVCGLIEVGYTKSFGLDDEGPFLLEEQLLLDTIATRIGTLIGWVMAEERLINTHREKIALYRRLILVLGSVTEMRAPYTAGHQKRVADLSVAIAEQMGLPEREVEGLQLAASVHDIGKVVVPTEILCKPTRLTRHEYELIKDHAQAGHNILKDVDFPWPIARIVLEHHERMNGSGYPNALPGEDLLMESRVLAVADVVESMCSHRPYRAGLGIPAALDEISRNSGILYDAAVVDACKVLFNDKGYSCRP